MSSAQSSKYFAMMVTLFMCLASEGRAQVAALQAEVRTRAAAVEEKVLRWRRDIHEHPELGDQETRTSRIVAEHLRSLGLEVRTGVARTGVIGVLRGQPGRTVALRADMDALPVKEPEGLPFASKAKQAYLGNDVDVMHACGHDAHTAMLMGVAEVLAGIKDRLPGTVLFIFQPAEEGPSLFTPASGKVWGAKLMLEEGAFMDPKPDAVFALHVMPGPLGQISYRTGATAASSDDLEITVTGRQGHGGMPWNTIDPVTTSALVISGLQTVVSRRANLTQSPAVLTIGTINGGSRANIVPEHVVMTGTIRTYDEKVRAQVGSDVTLMAEKIAESSGAKAEVRITPMYATTVNDSALAAAMASTLQRAADGNVAESPLAGASEDFSFFAQAVPGLYVFLGVTPKDQDPAKAAPNHNPEFFVDEGALVVGVRTMGTLALDFLASPPGNGKPTQTPRAFVPEER
jgi:amidohydrolase